MYRDKLVFEYVKERIGEKNFKKDKKKHPEPGYRFKHSCLVATICKYLIENLNYNDLKQKQIRKLENNIDLIISAALLHDIKKDSKNHGQVVADKLKEILKEISMTKKIFSKKEREKMEKIIANHSEDYNKNKYVKLIQDADKISKYYDFTNGNYLDGELNVNFLTRMRDKEVKEEHRNLNYIKSKEMLGISRYEIILENSHNNKFDIVIE